MTPLRCRMIEDMTLAGLTPRSRDIYVKSVRRLAAHYGRAPDQLSEAEVRSYLIKLRDRGVARGTFKVAHYAVQFLYQNTLGYDWPLFSKKRFVCRSTSGCRMCWPTTRSAICSVA
jgi:Phage integrase, N-terminal SAM-like domain